MNTPLSYNISVPNDNLILSVKNDVNKSKGTVNSVDTEHMNLHSVSTLFAYKVACIRLY